MVATADRDLGQRAPASAVIGAIAAAAALMFVVLRVAAHDGEITSLIRIGEDQFETAADIPDDLVTRDGIGYDGQYYYRQALDPLSLDERVDGIPLDRPAYRSTRITYPALVWALSLGGDRTLVPWMLVGANVLAVGAIAALGARLAEESGRSRWWGLVFAAWPGFVVGLAYDLAEPVEAALVLAGLLALRRDRGWLAGLALTAAVLTREGGLIIPVAIIVAAGLRLVRPRLPERLADFAGIDDRRPHLVAGLMPLATYVAMQVWMSSRWAETTSGSVRKSAEHVGSLPFSSVVSQLGEWFTSGQSVDLYQAVQVLVIVLILAIFSAALVRSPRAGTTVERASFVGALLLTSMLGGWDRMVVFLRWPDIAVMIGLTAFLGADGSRLPEWAHAKNVVRSVGILLASAVPIWIVI